MVSEANYHTTKWFSEGLLALEMKKIKVKTNKPVYLWIYLVWLYQTIISGKCKTINGYR